jgi:AcrR family transcriptional regulator
MPRAPDAEPVNHRTLVGQQRRERTRLKILAAALKVFARSGTQAPLIEDFIAEAGIARGTFYNYFRTTSELLEATIEWLSADFIESIECELGEQIDPLSRLAIGLQLWLYKAEHDHAWASFVARPDFIKHLPFEPVWRDLHQGRQEGKLNFPNERVAFDLLAGTMIIAMQGYVQGNTPAGYTMDIVRIVLQGLGVEPAQIETALSCPLPTVRRLPVSLPAT